VVIYLGVGFWLFYLLIAIDFCCLAIFDRAGAELIEVMQSSMPLAGCLPLWLSIAIGFDCLANFDRAEAEFGGEQHVIDRSHATGVGCSRDDSAKPTLRERMGIFTLSEMA
jgi:hypothetical protein